MTEIYLIALIGLLAGILLHGLAKPVRMYEYPYFMAAVFAGFLGPQAISLVRFPAGAPPAAVETTILMTLLCVLACLLGYRAPVQSWIVKYTDASVNDLRLFHFGMIYICSGIYFTYTLGQMTATERGGTQWSGRATIYYFFASLAYPGLSICLREALRRGGAGPWIWTVLGAWIPVVAALLYGRRESTVLFVMTIVLTLYFCRRKVVPRVAMAAAIIVALVGIPATTHYRSTLKLEGLSSVLQIDFVGNFIHYLTSPSELELRNGAMIIESVKRTGEFGLGGGYWDEIVFRFVPAQIVGRKLKASLMFDPNEKERREQGYSQLGYKVIVGSTITGIGDAYQEFGYFGALFFALVAVIFKSLWHTSHRRDSVFAQLLYIQTTTAAMLAITHQTVNYFPGLIYNLLFIGLAVLYARQRRTPAPTVRGVPSLR